MADRQATAHSDVPVAQSLWRAVAQVTGWLGALVGTMSAISAITRFVEVGLAPMLGEIVAFYRGLAAPVYALVDRLPVPFDIPPAAVDLTALYLVLFGMSVRSLLARIKTDKALHPEHFRLTLSRVFETVVLSLILWPVYSLSIFRDFFFSRRSLFDMGADVQENSGAAEMYAAAKKRDSYSKNAGGLLLWGWDARRYRIMRANSLLGVLQFVSVPAGVILFFLMNAYAPL